MDVPVLSAVLVSHNSTRWIEPCLQSVERELAELNPHELIVVDNGSSDDSVTIIRREFPQVRLILNDTNRGFAAAANQGIQLARGRYVLLMNFDVTLRYGMDQLVNVLELSPGVAAAVPRTY